MKATHLSKSSIWNFISDFTYPSFFSNPPDLKKHKYATCPSHQLLFIQKFLNENKLKDLYQRLEKLYKQALNAFNQDKKTGITDPGLHPKEEQKWFINYLQNQLDGFSTDELCLVIEHYEQREKYFKYLKCSEEINPFEIFLYNYLLKALSSHHLSQIFLHIYYGSPCDQESDLSQFFSCLNIEQSKLLFKFLKKEADCQRKWIEYCQSSISVMRNSQIKEVILQLPSEIENFALEKLYPCEILDVVDQESDEKKKRYLIDKVLSNYKKWWHSFSYEETSATCHSLKEKIS